MLKQYIKSHRLTVASALTGVAVCVLSMSLTIGGTFAWLIDAGGINSQKFKTASVELKITSSKSDVYVFQSGVAAEQIDLIGKLDTLTEPGEKDTYFTEWLSNITFTDLFEWRTGSNVPAGALLQREYDFTNSSEIPVYFMIDRARISGVDIALAAFWSTDGGTTKNAFEYDPDGERYYIKAPLKMESKTLKVTFQALLLSSGGGANEIFGSDFAEIIQAVNNAVYFAPEWQDIADKLDPYLPDND